MTLVPGVFSHSTAATFADARRDLEGTVVRDASGKMRPGLFFNHAGDLFSRRTDMRLNILDFRAVQDRGGACFFANQGTAVSPAFDAAPAANKRIDVLYVTQEIPALGDAGSVPVFGIVKGTASPTPDAPSLPANRADAIPLFDVEIPAGTTSMQSGGVIITPRYQYTAMAGGKVVVRNLVELAAWQPADSALAYCLSDTGEYVRQGGAWRGGIGAVTPASGVTLEATHLSKDGRGLVTLTLYASKATNLVQGDPIGSIPAGFLPVRTWAATSALAAVGSTESALRIDGTTGALSYLGTTSAPTLWVSCSYPAKTPAI